MKTDAEILDELLGKDDHAHDYVLEKKQSYIDPNGLRWKIVNYRCSICGAADGEHYPPAKYKLSFPKLQKMVDDAAENKSDVWVRIKAFDKDSWVLFDFLKYAASKNVEVLFVPKEKA